MTTAEDTRLSSSLYQILEVIGASEHARLMYSEDALTHEILHTASQDGSSSLNRFGSSHEGTTTPGLRSDMDVLFCLDPAPVVERLQDAPGYGLSYLMVTDCNTMPGYFQLQCVYNGVPQSIYYRDIDYEEEGNDALGRICRKHILVDLPEFKERNGPADTSSGIDGFIDLDMVPAFRCEKVSLETNTRLHKDRPCNWLSQTQIQTMKTYGCFFVGVGHPQSQTKSIEWRISFSLQERELMSSLNPTQHKFYILLKLIKKDIIQPRAGEKSISSYHCKTCLFYVLENTRPEWWTRTNLIQGVRVCLSFLLRWVRESNCPNNFIPEENMFDRLHHGCLGKIATVISEILKDWPCFLLSLQCDNLGSLVYSHLSGVNLANIRQLHYNTEHEALLLSNTSDKLYRFRHRFLASAGNVHEPRECLLRILNVLQYLQTDDVVRDRRRSDVRMVCRSLLPYIHLQIAQSIASIINTCGDAELIVNGIRAFENCIDQSKDFDLISSKLVLATCYLHANMLDKCDEILLTCETVLRDFVVSVCACDLHPYVINDSLLKLLKINRVTSEEYCRTCTTGCMLFLPGQSNLVHPALQLEMYRSVNTPPGSRNEVDDFWFDWILVDSRVYLYFLQYLLYSRINNEVRKEDVITNLLHLINADENLGHKETAYNLLGWICSQENRVHDALRCFMASWMIRPVHNAAKWHLMKTVFKIIRQRQGN